MKVLSDSHIPQATATAAAPIQKELSSEDSKVQSLALLNYPARGIEKLLHAVAERNLQVKNKKAAETKFSKIRAILFPPSIDKNIVKEIYYVAVRGFSYVNFSDSAGVKAVANQLHEFRLLHPAEFNAALPGLSARDVTYICNSLAVLGNVWDAVDAVSNGNPDAVERKINRAVKHFVNCGVPADDASLKQFHAGYLLKAQQLRAEATAVTAA